MKRILGTLVAVLVSAILAGSASAHPQSPRVDRREARQHARIVAGVRHGQLTRAEARRLRRGQMRIHRMEARAKADGRLTPRERARLAHAQNRESRRIWRLEHNRVI